MVVVDDLNDKSSNWYEHDKTTYEGSKIDIVTLELVHVLGNSSSCIDLIFTPHQILVI